MWMRTIKSGGGLEVVGIEAEVAYKVEKMES